MAPHGRTLNQEVAQKARKQNKRVKAISMKEVEEQARRGEYLEARTTQS